MSTLFKEEIMGKKSRRKRKLTRHHNVNRINGGTDMLSNIIMLRNEKHQFWHAIFKNLSFKEAADILLRADKMMKRRGENVKEKGG